MLIAAAIAVEVLEELQKLRLRSWSDAVYRLCYDPCQHSSVY